MKHLLLVLSLSVICISAVAEKKCPIPIFFEKNSSKLDLTFRNNNESLDFILDSLRTLANDSTYEIKNITFTGAASPDGNRSFNERLAMLRAQSLSRYISRELSLPDSIFTVHSIGRDWKGFLELVVADRNIPHYQEVVKLLVELTSDVDSINRLAEPLASLEVLDSGRVYSYLRDNHFSQLRAAYFSVVCDTLVRTPEEAILDIVPVVADTIAMKSDTIAEAEAEEVVQDTIVALVPQMSNENQTADDTLLTQSDTIDACRPFFMSVKSNLLYDAAMTPNAAIEFYLGAGFSLSAGWQYAWWKKDKTAFYWRTYGGDLEARYWFGKAAKEKPLTGHHIGLYGQMFTYDFEFGGKGILAPRWSWAAGLSYGYSLPIHRVLNIDFVAGVGYHSGVYHEYLPIDDQYVWQSTKRRRWIGPTKAEVTLVWLIGCDNYNRNPKFNKDKQQKVEENIQALTSVDKGGAL